jgi:hypothetical protein
MDPSLPELAVENEEAEQHAEDDTPFSLRPEWADVAPLDPDAGLPPVVAVQYDARDREVLGYFYAVVRSGELSARVLALTEEVRPVVQQCMHCPWNFSYVDFNMGLAWRPGR